MRYFYVICPVSVDPDFATKQSILTELGIAHSLQPLFPLSKPERFSLRDTTDDIQGADFVLADLSMERPSCYFELGLARTTQTPIHLIAAAGTPIHQVGDLGEGKVLFYSDLAEYRSLVTALLARPD